MSDAILDRLRDLIQEDVGKRGLRADPHRNLINACPDDFRAACHSLADHPAPGLAIVTGFFIPTATPPAGETDGPLGALFLARACVSLGIPVALVTDDFCVPALEAGLNACGLRPISPRPPGEGPGVREITQVPLVTLPTPAAAARMSDAKYWQYFDDRKGIASLTHLLAIERVGPSHDRAEVPMDHRGRCHTMRGRDITDFMSPAHRLFQAGRAITIGIGDGGNEIGMGKIPWDIIDRNIPNGGLVACATPADHLIVAGISNWGAYALAAGVALLRGMTLDASLFDRIREQAILEIMVQQGPLVDGVLGRPSATVDGLTWDQYARVLTQVSASTRNSLRSL